MSASGLVRLPLGLTKGTRPIHLRAAPIRPVPKPSLGLPAQILAGHTPQIDDVRNEETEEHPDIFVCPGLKQRWLDFWVISTTTAVAHPKGFPFWES